MGFTESIDNTETCLGKRQESRATQQTIAGGDQTPKDMWGDSEGSSGLLSTEPVVNKLLDMLSYRRPAQSSTTQEYVQKFIRPLAELPWVEWMKTDEHGSTFFKVGHSTVLFSSHVDSVHRNEGRQNVFIDSEGVIFVSDKDSNCLGGDDAVGNLLMLEMIESQVPGYYCFWELEERGALPSHQFGENPPAWAEGITHAIAFDRKGTTSIITHQSCGRCCSDEFAFELGLRLGLDHEPDTTGIFTDTACLVEIIPECTNISIGYANEHTVNETVDTNYVLKLRESLVNADWKDLPVVKKVGIERDYFGKWSDSDLTGYGGAFLSYGLTYQDLSKSSMQDIEDYVYMTSQDEVTHTILNLMDEIEELKYTLARLGGRYDS